MPKIIQIISAVYHSAATGSDTYLHALLDDGSVHFRTRDGCWKPVALPFAWEQPNPWKEFRRKMRDSIPVGGWWRCPTCHTDIYRYDSAALKSCWKAGHFAGWKPGVK